MQVRISQVRCGCVPGTRRFPMDDTGIICRCTCIHVIFNWVAYGLRLRKLPQMSNIPGSWIGIFRTPAHSFGWTPCSQVCQCCGPWDAIFHWTGNICKWTWCVDLNGLTVLGCLGLEHVLLDQKYLQVASGWMPDSWVCWFCGPCNTFTCWTRNGCTWAHGICHQILDGQALGSRAG
jgi:hypothetical protein